MGLTSDACWFLLIKSVLIKNNKKREAAIKNEVGRDEKHVFFFTWPHKSERYIRNKTLIVTWLPRISTHSNEWSKVAKHKMQILVFVKG